MATESTLVLVLLAIVVAFIVARHCGFILHFHRWRVFTPWSYRAYSRLRTERIEAERFFNVGCGCGHSFELSGVTLAGRISGLGGEIWCPECVSRVKIVSILGGRVMNEEERELQASDYEVLKEEWMWFWELCRCM